MTTDAPAAKTFYQQMFGWQPSEAMDMGPRWQVPDVQPRQPDDRRHDEQAEAALAQAPPFWTIYFRVPDINAATDRIKANGGTDPQRPDGGSWRRLDCQRQGSAGRGVRAARKEGVAIKTEDGRRKDGRRRTEDGGRRTEDGGRRTEDGKPVLRFVLTPRQLPTATANRQLQKLSYPPQ